MEIWREIAFTNGAYSISTLGNVRNNKTQRILKPFKYGNGYLGVALSANGESKKFKIHRLVALTFLENPNGYDQVNHKDECKTNNSLSNLEWCDMKYNLNYGTRTQRMAEKVSIPVDQFTIDGTFVKRFAGIIEASRSLGANDKGSGIVKVCKGKRKTFYGFIWKYSYK